jgi:hypothetical protein
MRLPPLSFGWAVSIALALALSGCGAFRLHDPGRMQTAGEALKSATELSSGGGAVFTPMEQNLDAVRSTQEKLRRLTDLHEFETFRGVLHRLGAEELGVRVVEALEKYNGANTFILEREAAAARSINDQLDRQALITKILNDSSAESAAARSRLDTTLKRIKTRLDWIEAAQSRLAAVKELTGASRPAGDVASVLIGGLDPKTDTGKAVADAIKAAENSLKNVESDKRVEAAEQLVKRAAEQTAASEHERLVEMQRYLADLARARQRLAVRDQIVACNAVPVLLGHLFPVLGNAEQTRFVAVYRDLQQRHSCIENLEPSASDADLVRTWGAGTVAQYVAADIVASQADATSPLFVAAVGVLLFHERGVFEAAQLDVARAGHRHSVRLSRIAAQQRLGLVHQLSEGLEIYYRGGVKPETVAQLLLAAAQVGALTFIGVGQ